MTRVEVTQREPRNYRQRDRTTKLYLLVIAAVAAGIVVGLAWPSAGVELKPLGTAFVGLVKMLIAPVIFCTIVLGIGSVRSAAKVGKVGGIALGYFLLMSTAALAIGLVVGNVVQPGSGLHITAAVAKKGSALAAGEHTSTVDFLLNIIPTSLFSAFTEGSVLQVLFVALLVGFAAQALGPRGRPVLSAVASLQKVTFKILAMVMWLAPIGAFGAIAAVVGASGTAALTGLLQVMFGFYVTCLLFVIILLGTVLRVGTGLSVLRLLKYLGRELLLIVSTSSSETALPRLMAKMEHVGVSRSVVGIVVPTGYSFNLDGTAIYLTMASLFIADASGTPMSIGQQIGLLLFMIVASKGAAGVTGAGLATLAAGLQAHRPDLLGGVGLVVGIDRFMSEARAVTNFSGNAVATLVIGQITGELDRDRARAVLRGEIPFDEVSFAAGDDPHDVAAPDESPPARPSERVPLALAER
jgi:aerobic C4-dicarboxylate transport protein